MAREFRIQAEPAFRTQHANPYNARLYTHVRRPGVQVEDLTFWRMLVAPPDVVHLHWPELTFLSGHQLWRVGVRLGLFLSILSVARLRGTRVVWTVHNLAAHESRWPTWVPKVFWSLFVRQVDSYLTLTEAAQPAVLDRHPGLAGVPHRVTPHGHYQEDYDLTVGAPECRRELGLALDDTVLVFLGQVRRYKNVPALLRAFAGVAGERLVLVVAGSSTDEATTRDIRSAAASDPRVRLDLRFLPDADLVRYARASDLVVLPYATVLNSGSAVLALSAGRPVLVPAIGALVELQHAVGSNWVTTYKGDLTSDVLAEVVSSLPAAPRGAPDLSSLEWPAIADATLDALRKTRARPRTGRFRSKRTTSVG